MHLSLAPRDLLERHRQANKALDDTDAALEQLREVLARIPNDGEPDDHDHP